MKDIDDIYIYIEGGIEVPDSMTVGEFRRIFDRMVEIDPDFPDEGEYLAIDGTFGITFASVDKLFSFLAYIGGYEGEVSYIELEGANPNTNRQSEIESWFRELIAHAKNDDREGFDAELREFLEAQYKGEYGYKGDE